MEGVTENCEDGQQNRLDAPRRCLKSLSHLVSRKTHVKLHHNRTYTVWESPYHSGFHALLIYALFHCLPASVKPHL